MAVADIDVALADLGERERGDGALAQKVPGLPVAGGAGIGERRATGLAAAILSWAVGGRPRSRHTPPCFIEQIR